MKELHCQGIWWLPENPDEKVAGTLSFSPGKGAVLDLVGSFDQLPQIMNFEHNTLPLILGVAKNQGDITLVECFNSGNHVGSILTQQYKPQVVFVGAHVSKQEELLFNKVKATFTNLTEWMGIHPFSIMRTEGNTVKKAKTFELKYEYPESIAIELEQGLITFQSVLHQRGVHGQKYEIENGEEVIIIPHSPKSFKELYQIFLFPLQNFFSLSMESGSYIDEIKVYADQFKMNNLRGGMVLSSITVYIDLLEGTRRTHTRHEMLFSFQDVKNNFPDYLRRWFDAYGRLKDAISQYFLIEYSPFMYLDDKFSILVNSLEAYHRHAFPKENRSSTSHKKKIADIISAVPEEHRDWLKGALQHSHEPRLGQRLLALVDNMKSVGIAFSGEEELILKDIVVTRNYFVHRDKRLKKRAATDERLYQLNQELNMLMKVQLLRELNFSADQIRAFIFRVRRI